MDRDRNSKLYTHDENDTVDITMCRVAPREDGIEINEYLKNKWDLRSLYRHFQRMTVVRPTNAFFINGKCVQAGALSPEDIRSCEERWRGLVE